MKRDGTLGVGFLGFGEAAAAIAYGLREAGVTRILAYDVAPGPLVRERAAILGPDVLVDLPDLAAGSDVLFSAVVSRAAVDAARSIAPYLRSGVVYADLNSCSPGVKRAVGKVVEPTGAVYAAVAVMSAVPPLRHRVPMLADGPGAVPLVERMAPYGMQIEVLDGPVGSAAAVKMLRSVIVKGLEALLLESLVPAARLGVAERILASIEASFGGMSFPELANHLLTRHAVHAARRADELAEAAETVEELGLDPTVTRAAAERLAWSARYGLKECFGGKLPPSYRSVIEALGSSLGQRPVFS